ncbi:geranylgeranyl reductase family protein, partial [Candidatus Altiarchaeota archaeon]
MAVDCDVLIVGAGPAGSGAARAAARRGANTIFIDKKTKPGSPVQCAEGIGGFLLPLLPFKVPKSLLQWKIEGILFETDELSLKQTGELWKGYTVERKDFDYWLAKKAIQSGASLWTESELVDLDFSDKFEVESAIIRKGEEEVEVFPRVVVAADGADSTVLKLLDVFHSHEEHLVEVVSWEMDNLKLRSPHMEQIFIGEYSPPGYGYIFPKSKTRANIGLGAPGSRGEVEKLFHEFLDSKPIKKQVKDGTWVVEKSKKAAWGSIADKWVYGNIILAGDVANHNLKPFVEGILPGVISGNL